MSLSDKHKSFDPKMYAASLLPILKQIEVLGDNFSYPAIRPLLNQYPKGKGIFSKADIISGYRHFAGSHGLGPLRVSVVDRLKLKPVRTESGVTPVSLLTKPFPCPGKCIFCPNDVRMPKSYLGNEPGAQRAERNHFHPYLQTYNRLSALRDIGHQVDKVEIIVLGGTWSFYPEAYQIWFIKNIFQAINDFSEGLDQRPATLPSVDVSHVTSPDTGLKRSVSGMDITYNQAVSQLYVDQETKKTKAGLETATWDALLREHHRNELSKVRCVGLVLETRPDYISQAEVIRLRRLGCTKTQIGVQSLQDHVLAINKRGHDVAATIRAFSLLRQAGFKIHAHWMPNLYGSTVAKDIKDYQYLVNSPALKPDELKIYPCSLIDDTELMNRFEDGSWRPYTYPELLEVLSSVMVNTPGYVRLTRVIRDIPGTDIVTGNKTTNFRQLVENHLKKSGQKITEIRSREIKNQTINPKDLVLDEIRYQTADSREIFLQYVTKKYQLVGFLRLSLPIKKSFIPELANSAIIREVHLYGTVVSVGHKSAKAAQHHGFGKKLIKQAARIAKDNGFASLAVISAIGTREYYRKLGFYQDELYQHLDLTNL